MQEYLYQKAFTRNIGWVTEWEQEALQRKCVAIAGMGGVGGLHLLTLARLGVGSFRIADFDTFDLVNFNRQVGATVDTVGRPKVEVMSEMALAINPALRIEQLRDGVTAENLDFFLRGVDLFVDGFDFFELGIRRRVFGRCAELGIPAITAAPLGMGTNWLIFIPGGMTFERYFRLEGCEETEQYLRFLIGLAPAGLHRKYLVDNSRVDLARKEGPSTGPACHLCAGVVGVEALKLLLDRDRIRPAPIHHHFDSYLGTYRRTRVRWGMDGPLQRLRLAMAKRFYLRRLAPSAPVSSRGAPATDMERIVDAARWAPSGDNAQPWRFGILGPDRLRVHFHNGQRSNPYEYRGGEPSLLSLGMLMETIRLAAAWEGRALYYEVEGGGADPLSISARLPRDSGIEPDPLASFITIRSVHRGLLRMRPLSPREKSLLGQALGPDLSVRWFETTRERWGIARLGAQVTDIRLRAPELFSIHQRVIDWRNRHSPTGLPARAVGLDRVTIRIMRWAMHSWQRMHWLNRLLGTRFASIQLDLVPGLMSAGFFSIEPANVARIQTTDGLIRTGAAIQRFWLTATSLGLAIQPASALLMIAHYAKANAQFPGDPALRRKAGAVANSFAEILGAGSEHCVFIGRIGHRAPILPAARSVRRAWSELTTNDGFPAEAP